MSWYGHYKPYVSVAQRRAQAAREVALRIKQGEKITPVQIEGRKITSTFWGMAWCNNLESYGDFANRLPRGRTYVRNGSVVHLAVERGVIHAFVSGSEVYQIKIEIAALSAASWNALKIKCAGQVDSLVELLQGKISQSVMAIVTNKNHGLFPQPQEIQMRCSCPDYAGMCKHVAAVMYGVGNRLDATPELLFRLRGVNQSELIEQAIPTTTSQTSGKTPRIAAADLGGIFDMELGDASTLVPPSKPNTTSVKPAATRTTFSQPASKATPAKSVQPKLKATISAAKAKAKVASPKSNKTAATATTVKVVPDRAKPPIPAAKTKSTVIKQVQKPPEPPAVAQATEPGPVKLPALKALLKMSPASHKSKP